MLPALPEQSIQTDRAESYGRHRAPCLKKRSRMRIYLVNGVTIGRLLMALTAVVAVTPGALAQEFPSLSGAVASGGGEVWSGGDPGGVVATPSLAGEYLAPIADGEYGAAFPDEPCNSCNGGSGVGGIRGFYNRCGCETPLFPWFTGPGRCDNWCVGPHWNVELDGMFVHREDADWSDIADTGVVDQFDYGPGVRLFATGYNYSNYGLQIGYEGVNDFHSTAVVESGPGVTTNEVTYESTFNSLEINLLRRTSIPLKIFAGFRYVEIDEDLINNTLATGDSVGTLVENRLIGAQIGALRDAWQLNRWVTIEPFGNVGVYLNDFKREDADVTAGVFTNEAREFSEIAFLGEAGVTSVLRINACLALRGGYQVMAFDGVSDALQTSLAANNGFDPDELIYHGARFGIEYQR